MVLMRCYTLLMCVLPQVVSQSMFYGEEKQIQRISVMLRDLDLPYVKMTSNSMISLQPQLSSLNHIMVSSVAFRCGESDLCPVV